jgi:ankyrin repeat protein
LVEPFLSSLRTERTVGNINDALRGLRESPDKIATVYERTLRRLNDHPPKDQEMARRILAWVLLAKRPLGCREFQHALSVRIGEDFDKDYLAGNLEEAVALCAGLVVINKESDTVQLMHHTARSYFKAAATQLPWITSTQAGAAIADTCLTYILFSAFSEGPCPSDETLRARLEDFPFLSYAGQQWGNHMRENDMEATSQTKRLALRFLSQDASVSSAHQVLHLPAYEYPGYSQHFIHGANGLQLAASFGLTSLVGRLLADGADIAARDADGGTALHRAAENGHVDVVLLLLRREPGIIDLQKSKHRHTALHLAALNGNAAVVTALLRHGACATLRDDQGWTALHVAAWTGKKDSVGALLSEMDVHARGKDGVTALHCAAGQGQRAIAELLIARGANVDITDSYGWTPLHWASKKRHDLAKLRRLEFGEEESTGWAEQMKKITKVTGMLRDTFDLPKKLAMLGGRQSQPAYTHWQDDLAYAPDGFALDLSTNDRGTLTMLYFSAQVDRFVPPWLLSKQGDEQVAAVRLILAVQDELGALQCLVQCGHRTVAEVLLDNGAKVDATCRAVVATKFRLKMAARPTALHMACLSGHEPMAQILLDRGADTECLCELGIGEDWLTANLTPLHCAVISGNKGAVQLLLRRGTNVNAACHARLRNLKVTLTSLYLAIIWGHVEVAKLLLDHGADASERCHIHADNSARARKMPYADLTFAEDTDIQLAPVHVACIFGTEDMIRELVRESANCKALLQATFDGLRFRVGALHLAALLSRLDGIDLLVAYGARVNAKAELDVISTTCCLRMSALHLAALCNDLVVADKLLAHGANVNGKGQVTYGNHARIEWTALDCAALQGDARLIHRLYKAGAHVDVMLQAEAPENVGLTTELVMEQAGKMFAALLGDNWAPHSTLLDALMVKAAPGEPGRLGPTARFELCPLHLAALSRDHRKVEALLKNGADVHRLCTVQAQHLLLEASPLHIAMIWGVTGTVVRLLDAGARCDVKLQILAGSFFRLELHPLHLAALAGDAVALTALIARGATDTQGLLCIGSARVEVSPIHLAAMSGNSEVTAPLLSHGSDPESLCGIKVHSTTIRVTPLHIAAALKRNLALSMLLDSGSDVNRKIQVENEDSEGTCSITPLHLLLLMGHGRDLDGSVGLFLGHGADATAPFQWDLSSCARAQLSALHLAAMTADWNVIWQLLGQGADAAAKGSLTIRGLHLDISVIHCAGLGNRESVVKSLVKNGASPDERCRLTLHNSWLADLTPLHLAALNGYHHLVELLLQNDASPHRQDQALDTGNTQNIVSPLHLALLRCDLWTIEMLVDGGASILDDLQIDTERCRITLSAFGLAAFSRDVRLTKFLVQRGADVNATSRVQTRNVEVEFTSLALAALRGNKPALVYLLKHGADSNQPLTIRVGPCSIHLPPLHLAARPKTRKLVRILLKYKADPNGYARVTGNGWCISWTALHLAALHETPAVAELLLHNGAQIHDNLTLRTHILDAEIQAIHLAIALGSKEVVSTLLARARARGEGGNQDTRLQLTVSNKLATQLSALHVALLLNKASLVDLLRDEDVDVDAPYVVAVRQQFRAEISAFLLSALAGGGDAGHISVSATGLSGHVQAYCEAKIDMMIQFELNAADVMTGFGTREATHGQDHDDDKDEGAGRNLALYLATALGWDSVLKVLLERTDGVDDHQLVRIHAAVDAAIIGHGATADTGHSSVTELEIKTDISVLHLAAVLGNIEAARLLLAKGADIDATCYIQTEAGFQAQFPPLMLAATWKHDGMARLLLRKDATVSLYGQATIARNIDGTLAARNISVLLGDKRVGEVLKDVQGIHASIEAQLTSLHLAVLVGDLTVVNLLLNAGADPDTLCKLHIMDDGGQHSLRADFQVHLKPLHLASWAGHEAVAGALLDSGANVNARIQAGGTASLPSGAEIKEEMQARGTALHMAAGLGHEEVVRILREHGADMCARTRDGRTALQWASEQGWATSSFTGMVRGLLWRLQRTFYNTRDGKDSKSMPGA